MKLTFLGTSHGVPGTDRYCTSFLLEVDDNMYLIDTGAPVSDLLIRKNKKFSDLKAVFTSHFHLDHAAGSIHLIDLSTWYYKDASFDFFVPEERAYMALRNLIEATGSTFDEDRVRFKAYDRGIIFNDEKIKVEAIPTKHTSYNPVISAYAFYIEAEGKRILFTNDMSIGLAGKDFPEIAFCQHLDLIVTECAHFNVEVLSEYLDRVDASKVAVTHVYPVTKYDELIERKDEFDFELILPDDDDCIIL